MVDRITDGVSTRPVSQQDMVEALNREFIPRLRQTLMALNALLGRYLEGEGSPEGVVTADIGAMYQDRTGTLGAITWLKTADDSNTGWVAVL